MAKLGDIKIPCRGRWSSDGKKRDEREDCTLAIDHDGDCVHPVEEKPAEKPKQRLLDAVADPMKAPFGWQSAAPSFNFKKGEPVSDSTDLQRILALPRRPVLDLESVTAEAIIELEMAKYARQNDDCHCARIDPRRPCLKRMLPAQAWMLREIAMRQGLIASGSVGLGKTFVFLIAALALTNVETVLLLIPSSLLDQIALDYRLISQHFHVPGLIVHAGDREIMKPVIIPGRPTVNVLPYSRLSLADSSDWIKNLNPDAILADECDNIKSLLSSRGMRVAKYMMGDETLTPEEIARRHSTKFVGMTGSLLDQSVTELNWLCLFALKDGSPLPLDPDTVEEWGRCIDATGNPSAPGRLVDFAEQGEDIRHAVRRRLAETPGFVVADVSTVQVLGKEQDLRIIVEPKDAPSIPRIILDALDMVRGGERPDSMAPDADSDYNEELEDDMAIARCALELATGMFYRWTFPNGEPTSLIKEWLKVRKAYNREVRIQSQMGETYMDSALLCEQAAMRAWGDLPPVEGKPEWKNPYWPAWKEIRDRVKPLPKAVWLDDFIVNDAAEWALSNTGIVWYNTKELARRIHEKTGLPVHDGGSKGGERLRQEKGDRSIISSIKSNGRGRDGLQHIFCENLVINPPASSTLWEQLIGRGYRRGQKSDYVRYQIYLHTPELKKSVRTARVRSRFVKDILGANMKLLMGWNGDASVDDEDE